MKSCAICGREVRLRVVRGTINRKRGVGCWLEPADGEQCPCLKDWLWDKMVADKTKPSITERKLAEWDALQTTGTL